jgi:hypothetical protein
VLLLILRYLTGKKDERVAILISGKPTLERPKLLGFPVIKDSTDASQHNAVIKLLDEWEVTKTFLVWSLTQLPAILAA